MVKRRRETTMSIEAEATIHHCPYCGARDPIELPGRQELTAIARCRRCNAVFSCTMIAWDPKGDSGNTKKKDR